MHEQKKAKIEDRIKDAVQRLRLARGWRKKRVIEQEIQHLIAQKPSVQGGEKP